MARKLRVFQTSLGFFDLAVAAPSMKAALKAWGADSNLFHQGVAKESGDPDVIAVATSKPGVILRRPVGADGPFKEHAELPISLSPDAAVLKRRESRATTTKHPRREADDATRRAAVQAFKKQQSLRDSERRRQEAARERQRERQRQAVAKAQGALQKAEREHDRRTASIKVDQAVLEKRLEVENERWEKQKQMLETALRRARD